MTTKDDDFDEFCSKLKDSDVNRDEKIRDEIIAIACSACNDDLNKTAYHLEWALRYFDKMCTVDIGTADKDIATSSLSNCLILYDMGLEISPEARRLIKDLYRKIQKHSCKHKELMVGGQGNPVSLLLFHLTEQIS